MRSHCRSADIKADAAYRDTELDVDRAIKTFVGDDGARRLGVIGTMTPVVNNIIRKMKAGLAVPIGCSLNMIVGIRRLQLWKTQAIAAPPCFRPSRHA
jgi:hypothetical protein